MGSRRINNPKEARSFLVWSGRRETRILRTYLRPKYLSSIGSITQGGDADVLGSDRNCTFPTVQRFD